MTDPNSILPLTANTLNPFDTATDTRSSVETERKQRSLIRKLPPGEFFDPDMMELVMLCVWYDEELFSGSDPTNIGSISSAPVLDVRLHQRNGRKTLTTIEGLPKEVDPKKVVKVFKKDFACNGSIVQEEETGMEIIQLQGDHRQKVLQVLVENGVCKKEDIQIHGF